MMLQRQFLREKLDNHSFCTFRNNLAWLEAWNDISSHVSFNGNQHPIWEELLERTYEWHKKFSLDSGDSIALLDTCVPHWRQASSRNEYRKGFKRYQSLREPLKTCKNYQKAYEFSEVFEFRIFFEFVTSNLKNSFK